MKRNNNYAMSKFTLCYFVISIVFTYFILAIFNLAYSKVIYEPHLDSDVMTIRIVGEITSTDLDDFKNAIKQIEESKKKLHMNSVVLMSYGGNGNIARKIGEIVRAKKLNTYLPEDSRCESACVSILISGVQRYAFGRVGVHRTTYSRDIKDDSRVEKDINESLKLNADYIKRMGVSLMLDDAINTTESWRMRQLSETEKKQWNIFGFDRLTEELLFNQISRSRFISRNEFIDIFKSQYDDCIEKAKDFKLTVFECAKTRNLKPPSLLARYKKVFLNWTFKINDSIPTDIAYKDKLQLVNEKLRSEKMYLRYMLINEVADVNVTTKNSSFKQESKTVADQMEAASIWWVEDNKIHVMLKNPTDHNIKRVVFSIGNSDCENSMKKRYMTFDLPMALETKNTSVYIGELPFNFHESKFKGLRCGLIEGVLTNQY